MPEITKKTPISYITQANSVSWVQADIIDIHFGENIQARTNFLRQNRGCDGASVFLRRITQKS